ncbi:MAG: aspartate--tRNA ligase [Rickettsiales bacterium]|jgi:aspartyl-tRNA synthetase|nr:aspartate--tRNA ligase [Rickettsiales bacterium]
MSKYRTHTCNDLKATDVGKQVKLAGWVHSIRDHGSLLFIDLRDNYGITQCVIDVEKDKNLVEIASGISDESVILIEGRVIARGKEAINPNLVTGEIEIGLNNLIIESQSDPLPFQVADETQNYPEDLRLKYRFLDLRTKKMHHHIHLRDNVIQKLRSEMIKQGFHEFQTPILTSSSPEGARDFLVPSRIHKGKFYALPQAPQQFKQLLMVSGFDKYFQVAPCFRDEDPRADRLLSFYQLDIEMSFVEQEDVWNVVEPVIYNTFREIRPDKKINSPFPRITHKDAILKYGTDKPDLRNPIEMSDVTEVFRGSNFAVFAKAIEVDNKIVVRAIPAPNSIDKSRSFFDKMTDFAISEGAKGLGYINFTNEGEAKGPVAKFLDSDRLEKLKKLSGLKNGDSVFFSCSTEKEAAKLGGKVRTKIGQELGLIDSNEYKFCWIIDFPFFEQNEETSKIDFAHNPFSMPNGGLDALINTKDPYGILSCQYDLACNGYELTSGAVRNTKPEVMYKAFEMVGYSKEVVDTKFGGMLSAFKFGAPPHAGCAPGIERIVMLLCDETNLREVNAFPTTGKGEDLLMSAPSDITEQQLKELHIKIRE